MKKQLEAKQIAEVISGYQFSFYNESDLQAGLALILREHGIRYEAEVRISLKDRLDFLIKGGIAIETKIGGSLNRLTQQVHRYAQSDQVKAIIVLSPRAKHARLPAEINGKPVFVVTPSSL